MFANTKVISNRRSSSILIKFDEYRGVSEFQLPTGFDNFPGDSYELKKELFFQTYHTYRKFINEKKSIVENQKGGLKNNTIVEEDTVTETSGSFQFKEGLTGEVITYQKLVMFDSIIDAYDELRIQSLQDKISKSDAIDYSQIHKYLHQAIYLSNDVIYIDEVDLPKKIIKEASTELVEMFCYIYSEILKEFGTLSDNQKVVILANNFKEKRLFEESSLFSEDSYEDTLEILKEVLEEIDQTTPYKDFDYWHFFDAVHNFIYSNNDGSWSLDNFSFIWERMCLAFAKKYYLSQIALYDNFGSIADSPTQPSLKSYYKVSLNSASPLVRFIRPDLILRDCAFKIDDLFLERIYTIKLVNDRYFIYHKENVDYEAYSDVEKVRFSILGRNKLNIKPGLFNTFLTSAKSTLSNRNYFELASRHPKVINPVDSMDMQNSYLIVDFKYMSENSFTENLDIQVNKTVKKQLVYELALKLNRNANTKSEFWIPAYLPARNDETIKIVRKYSKNCDSFFNKYRISVIQLDFLTLQQLYIQDVF